jgi:hypothetical protein
MAKMTVDSIYFKNIDKLWINSIYVDNLLLLSTFFKTLPLKPLNKPN